MLSNLISLFFRLFTQPPRKSIFVPVLHLFPWPSLEESGEIHPHSVPLAVLKTFLADKQEEEILLDDEDVVGHLEEKQVLEEEGEVEEEVEVVEVQDLAGLRMAV